MIRIYQITFCLLSICFLMQCSSTTTTKPNVDNMILLTLNQGERFSEKTKETMDILTNRLITMGVENPLVLFDEHFIQVEIPDETDLDKFADLLCNTGKFEVYPLYSVSDLLPYFKTINDNVESGKYVDDDIPLKNKLNGKTLLEWLSLPPIVEEIEVGPLVTASRDVKQKIQYILGRTADPILLQKDYPGLEFRWIGNFETKGMQTLYAINKSNAHISNKHIEHIQIADERYGKLTIQVGCDALGTRNFGNLTTLHKGKTGVISLDNITLYSPIFKNPVTSGTIFLPMDTRKDLLIAKAILKSGAFHKKLLIEDYKVIKNGKVVDQRAVLSPDQIREFESLRKKIQYDNELIFSAIDDATLSLKEKQFLKTKIHQASNQHIYNTIAERRLSQLQLEQLINGLKKIEAQLGNPTALKQLLKKIEL